MKRLFIVYNPRSSHYETVTKEVLEPARKVRGWMVGRYEIKESGFEENRKTIAGLLNDGDLVVVAGGDGTVAMTVNAIVRAGKDVVLGVLGYGNFNDIAKTLRIERPVEYGGEFIGGIQEIMESYEAGRIARLYPLEVRADGELWRYAVAYFTMGMLAKATEIFDEPKVRRQLQTGKKKLGFSIRQLAKWYFRKGKKYVLPEGEWNGRRWRKDCTDYLAVNGAKVAGIMKGGDWYQRPKEFASTMQSLGRLGGLLSFMMKSMRKVIPGLPTERDEMKFAQVSRVELHAEGEYEERELQTVSVTKAERPVKVVLGKAWYNGKNKNGGK